MELKPGYKQTDVGAIPEQWKVKRIGDIAAVSSGGTPSRQNASYWDGDIPWVTTSQIDFCIINDAEQFISESGLKNSAAKLFSPGTLLMALYGQGKTRGKTSILGISAATNQACASIELNRQVDRDYIFHFLASKYEDIRGLSNGGSQENLNGHIVKNILIALPEQKEQRAIAVALSDVDALLNGLDKLISKKRDIKQAAMQRLLTGKQRLPGFSEEWEKRTLGNLLIRVANGAVYRQSRSIGVPVTRIETIADGTIDFSRVGYANLTPDLTKYKVEKGDILFSHINSVDHIGKVAIFDGRADLYHGMNLLLLRVGASFDSNFLFFWLRSEFGRKKSMALAKQAVSQASINTSELKAIEIDIPSLAEQTRIAAILSDMDIELAALKGQRNKTRALKQGMMQELLTGRIRLV